MANIFEKILTYRALSVIHQMVEDDLASTLTTDAAQVQALKSISETRDLDLVYAFAHEQLGNHDKAVALRKWVSDRDARKKAFK